MKIELKSNLLTYLKGLAMGAADVVPGVSGGTIAFITGIYDRLLGSISEIDFSLIKEIKNEGILKVWERINGTFLLFLLAGIGTSILLFSRVINYLLIHHPIALWSFFFGLIIASIFYVGKQVEIWDWKAYIACLIGVGLIYWVSVMAPFTPSASPWFLFLAGAIAICAMILPGISGSFILLILGAYAIIMQAIADLDFAVLIPVALGAGIGLISFSKFLHYLLEKHRNTTIAMLTGFLIGSLFKIWPWKIDEKVFVKHKGVELMVNLPENTQYQSLTAFLKNASPEVQENVKPYVQSNVSPDWYALQNGVEAQLTEAVIFAVVGFGILFFIEWIAKKMQNGTA